jgi:hypothetical protein
VADDVVPDALKKGGTAAAGGAAVAGGAAIVAGAAAGYAAYETIKQTTADNARENKAGPYKDYSEGYSAEENAARNYKMFHGVQFEGGMHRVGLGAGPAPGVAKPRNIQEEFYADILQRLERAQPETPARTPDVAPIPPVRPEVEFGSIMTEAEQIGAGILAALSVTAKPNIDLNSLVAARNLARETLNLIQQIGAASMHAEGNLGRQMRRSMSDYGISATGPL